MTIYPAHFIKEEDGYSVIFPDLPGCVTQGMSLEEAAEMAAQALGLYLISLEERKIAFPSATEPTCLKPNTGEFVSLVSVNLNQYRRTKSVKKTLTIPQWLNDEAEKQRAPFSKILQDGLLNYLHLS